LWLGKFPLWILSRLSVLPIVACMSRNQSDQSDRSGQFGDQQLTACSLVNHPQPSQQPTNTCQAYGLPLPKLVQWAIQIFCLGFKSTFDSVAKVGQLGHLSDHLLRSTPWPKSRLDIQVKLSTVGCTSTE
jgi:hypothetical protein